VLTNGAAALTYSGVTFKQLGTRPCSQLIPRALGGKPTNNIPMAQFNFSCPHCHQLVQGDDQWTGQLIQCPACAGEIIVPANAAAPVAPPPTTAPAEPQKPVSKLRVTATPHAPAPPPPTASPSTSPVSRPTYSPPKPKKSSEAIKWAKIGGIVAVICVAIYFSIPYLRKWQAGLSAPQEDDGTGVAGQVGHINALNDVLDRTEPDHIGMSSKEAASADRQEKRLKARMEAQEKQFQAKAAGGEPSEQGTALAKVSAEMASMPLASGIWSMEASGTVPEGRANGMISGTNFVVDTAVLVKVGPNQVLTLSEGTNVARADRALFVSFQLPTGEELAGHTWNISPEMKGKGVPQVVKRWKTKQGFAPSKKAFPTGYAMQLEFSQPTNGVILGKISVSMPDPEQSYVVGAFKAALMTPGAN
jgi:hypothetical protein